MTNMVAIIPIANLVAANTTPLNAGFGPKNFSVECFSNGNPTHAALHAWRDPAFQAAVQALPGVIVNIGVGNPTTRLLALLSSTSVQWGDNAPTLPSSGNASANTLYTFNNELWWCIQTFNRTTFNLPPSNYPALIRRCRRPKEVLPWVQPIDQFDAYKLVNPFTGLPDRVTHLGQVWVVSQADGAGNNVFEPGVFGWTSEGPAT